MQEKSQKTQSSKLFLTFGNNPKVWTCRVCCLHTCSLFGLSFQIGCRLILVVLLPFTLPAFIVAQHSPKSALLLEFLCMQEKSQKTQFSQLFLTFRNNPKVCTCRVCCLHICSFVGLAFQIGCRLILVVLLQFTLPAFIVGQHF